MSGKQDTDVRALVSAVAARAAEFLGGLDSRPVFPTSAACARLSELCPSLPENGAPADEILRALHEIGSPATVACAGRRYFGFVTGGALPAALAANWLAGAWDQNVFSHISSPVGAVLDACALRWIVDVLGLPSGTGGALVTGATMASVTGLAAARHEVLRRVGWDVGARGLIGAPAVSVILSEEAHSTTFKALSLLGFGRDTATRVATDEQGRLRADALPEIDAPAIVCLQAGNVNTGAFDPAAAVIGPAHAAGAWVHVDGAFGLWAAAAPARAHLMEGYAEADSWAVDGHKWLNVPYDSGIALVRRPETLSAAMSIDAAYLMKGGDRNPIDFTPDTSRRMRGVEIWAALMALGRQGVADLIERNCRQAARFAQGLRGAGFEVLNDVVLNQVLVSFGTAEQTERVIAAVQADGTCWCGGTVWHDIPAMRISVSSWATTDDDVERSLGAIIRIAAEQTGDP